MTMPGDGTPNSEMLQTELAGYMGMCGRPTLATVNASLVRAHGLLPGAKSKHA